MNAMETLDTRYFICDEGGYFASPFRTIEEAEARVAKLGQSDSPYAGMSVWISVGVPTDEAK